MIKPNKAMSITVLGFGYLFLYLPIILLVIYSFNESALVTVWSRVSVKWYGALLQDGELMSAAWLSIRVALLTATASVVVGTIAGFVLARFGRFRFFTMFSAMINAPLVMPEVIIGISMLLLFVQMQQLFDWPHGRGLLTIWIGHTTLCVSYVAILVQSRVKELDMALEEAAMDLGATPLRIFFAITLPLISQALAAGWLLSFTLSLDDLVLSAFLSGPGSTTLPMVVFSRVRLGLNPEMNALATLFITTVTIGVVGVNQYMRAKDKRLVREMQMAFAEPATA